MRRLVPLLSLLSVACTGQITLPSFARGSGTGGQGNSGGSGNTGGGGGGTGQQRLVCDDAPHAAVSQGRRITPSQYSNAIAAIFNGAVAASAHYPGAYGKPVTGYTTEAAINDVGAQSIDDILSAAEDVALALQPKLPSLLPCSQNAKNDACANTFLDTFARRAYRRAPTADERANLLGTLHDAQAAGAAFDEAICIMTAHLLQTPRFLYVLEDAAPAARALSSDELASRLSFTLWDSIPDDALLDAATSGQLATTDQLVAQAQRMIDASGADGTLARFFREWTGTTTLVPGAKDLTVYPNLTNALATSINSSFDRFAADTIRNQGTVESTLTGSSAFVDSQLAGFFGVTAPPSGQWQKVALDPAKYTGVVTQPAMMAALAHQQQASFVFRGKFIDERLLCRPLGSPPANAQAVFMGLTLPANPTGKEVAAGIESNATCAACHVVINPPGLAFENFDAIGHFQQAYPSGRPIDPSGSLPLGTQAIAFTDQTQLMQQLAALDDTKSCIDRQLFRFTFSRQETTADGCALQAMGDALASSNGELRGALVALVGSDAFQWKVDP